MVETILTQAFSGRISNQLEPQLSPLRIIASAKR